MLHLAKKAFYPSVPPFPLLHIDTTWKFREMYKFREKIIKHSEMELIIYQNPEAVRQKINPFDHASYHTDMWKTEALKQAIDLYKYDVAFGGARRDEEKSRAKERIFSFRTDKHRWDPKVQRPELWSLYNVRKSKNESIRVFPLSNWTELDVWMYIYKEGIKVVPLYFSALRPTVMRSGLIIMVDDKRFQFKNNEKPITRSIRFRTLGCYPLTGAIESKASNVLQVISEILSSTISERQGRAIDNFKDNSMEIKKQQGYF
jgi:sulfate adenylyltransferase subunit 2